MNADPMVLIASAAPKPEQDPGEQRVHSGGGVVVANCSELVAHAADGLDERVAWCSSFLRRM
jgi:hypothetical protein